MKESNNAKTQKMKEYENTKMKESKNAKTQKMKECENTKIQKWKNAKVKKNFCTETSPHIIKRMNKYNKDKPKTIKNITWKSYLIHS